MRFNQAYVAAKANGQRVKRIESYADACTWCRSINGKIYTVVAPNDPNRNGDTDIWCGKDNSGRSISPMKRVGDHLVERPASERFWVAAGLQHMNCRGSWGPVDDRPPHVSEDFFRFTQGLLDEAEAKNPIA